MQTQDIQAYVHDFWQREIVPALQEFIRIPNESPAFDRDWAAHGHMARAVELVRQWVERQQLQGATVRVLQDGAHTPLLLVDVPGALEGTALLYGHLDKQPPMTGWREGLGPWEPVLDEEGRLYGRGGADDGYAVFAAVAAIRALQEAGEPHGRLVLLIECSEESGSPDLPHYLEAYGELIGEPSLVVCLDSGAGNYEQLWSTTSLRGLVSANVTVEVLGEGVHSGIAGGVVPNPMQVMRLLLDRLENPATGELRPGALKVKVPAARIEQARQTAQVLGGAIVTDFPLLEDVRPLSDDRVRLLLNSTWSPTLAVTGQDGLPETDKAGNVILPRLTYRLSLRIPPTLATETAISTLHDVLEDDPPFGARVTVEAHGDAGWDAPELAAWLADATDAASREFYGREACYFGIGGSIPFINMIGRQYPHAQFLITGVLGPSSNAHGPNEFLHVPYATRLTCCLVRVLSAHHTHHTRQG